jgi:hypothetical protein
VDFGHAPIRGGYDAASLGGQNQQHWAVVGRGPTLRMRTNSTGFNRMVEAAWSRWTKRARDLGETLNDER